MMYVKQKTFMSYHLKSWKAMSKKMILTYRRRVNRNASAAVQRAMEASLAVKGANLFNLLPQYIRNLSASNPAEVEIFKAKLDTFLRGVPDQSTIPGRPRAAETNSLILF